MNVSALCLGIFGTNCYIITTADNNAIIIDPACDANKIIATLEDKSIKLKAILLTHGHYDHILAAQALKGKFDVPVYIHESDSKKLSDTVENLYARHVGMEEFFPVESANYIRENDKIVVDELTFDVLHTPGHTGGSVCYRCEDSIFTGDTLFAGSIGRTDFPDGDYAEITASILRLAELEGDYKVYPGHGQSSTLAYERKNNIFLADFDQI